MFPLLFSGEPLPLLMPLLPSCVCEFEFGGEPPRVLFGVKFVRLLLPRNVGTDSMVVFMFIKLFDPISPFIVVAAFDDDDRPLASAKTVDAKLNMLLPSAVEVEVVFGDV